MRLPGVLVALASLAIRAQAQDASVAAAVSKFNAVGIPAALGIPFNPTYVLSAHYTYSGFAVYFASGAHHTGSIPLHHRRDRPGSYVVAIVDLDVDGGTRYYLASGYAFNWRSGWLEHAFDGTPAGAPINYITDWKTPPPNVGEPREHRLVYLAFKQSPGFDGQTLVTPETPAGNWSLSAFVNATQLGEPVAGVFCWLKN
ncbi:hypothetical protein D9611_010482 [Ephemerocybe angulata]|uniref:Uncharacterized protein n=1 Tax=Ephemerocybe angulata TaxID=980116 RepID=A0A8H5FAT2_9AGAR|nr:hypothetical protein D9611_010482 [Tulosesus angulatus]